MKCLFGHTWYITVTVHDPMHIPTTFSNYVNTFYHCECGECGKKKTVKKTRLIPEGSQELENRKRGFYFVSRRAPVKWETNVKP